MTFSDMGLCAPVLQALTAEGYTTPTPIQAGAIPAALAGRDVLGSAQTGTGKTAAFALPMLHRLTTMEPAHPNKTSRRRIRGLVLSPTRELAFQIGDAMRTYGQNCPLRQTCVVGGVGQQPQVAALQRGVDILVATPGRLEDLYNQGFIDLKAVEMFVLDEADRMLDMGFLPAIRKIVSLIPTVRQTLFFSATMPRPIAELANGILKKPDVVSIAPVKTTTELVSQFVYHTEKVLKPRLLATMLTNQPIGRAIIFTRTKHGADRLAGQLAKVGIPSAALHGGKTQGARRRALEIFKSNRPPVLVATDVAARGIDVDAVSHVFNYDLPEEPETYVHRIGRTGRAGAKGLAISFCDETERRLLRDVEKEIRQAIPVHPQVEIASFPAMSTKSPMENNDRDRPRGFNDRPPPRDFGRGPTRPMRR